MLYNPWHLPPDKMHSTIYLQKHSSHFLPTASCFTWFQTHTEPKHTKKNQKCRANEKFAEHANTCDFSAVCGQSRFNSTRLTLIPCCFVPFSTNCHFISLFYFFHFFHPIWKFITHITTTQRWQEWKKMVKNCNGKKRSRKWYLRCELDRRMIFSRNVFCGATKPLRPPGIFVNCVQFRVIQQHTNMRVRRRRQ